MKRYNIACIVLELPNNICYYLDGCWNEFISNNESKIDIRIHILNCAEFYGIESISLKGNANHIMRSGADMILSNAKYSEAYVLPIIERDNISKLLLQLYLSAAIYKHMLLIHSSLISNGIMFLGPSGIGKTTQAELWKKYRDVLIINGDRVFVQETSDGFLGWGTPWHGSSPYCENTSVPVKAMIVLKQAPENSIRELTGFEKVTEVSNSVFYPQWLENGMELCLEILDHLLTSIPVYELSCRPEEGAVRLVEETVFGSREI